jgi:serine/threonine-protein kinase RsbW
MTGAMNTRPMNLIHNGGWRAGQGAPTWSARSPAERTFQQADVPSVRRFAAGFGARAGLGSARRSDFVLAVSEAAACVVGGGPGTARLRLWTTGPRVLCEVRGDSTPGRCAGGPVHGEAQAMRRSLLRQLCDQVSVSSGGDGLTVVLSMTVS